MHTRRPITFKPQDVKLSDALNSFKWSTPLYYIDLLRFSNPGKIPVDLFIILDDSGYTVYRMDMLGTHCITKLVEEIDYKPYLALQAHSRHVSIQCLTYSTDLKMIEKRINIRPGNGQPVMVPDYPKQSVDLPRIVYNRYRQTKVNDLLKLSNLFMDHINHIPYAEKDRTYPEIPHSISDWWL